LEGKDFRESEGSVSREEIIKLARQAGAIFGNMEEAAAVAPIFERFAALVAAAEREECAKVCEAIDRNGAWVTKAEAAAAIKARSKQ
jgi:hypothetical protein